MNFQPIQKAIFSWQAFLVSFIIILLLLSSSSVCAAFLLNKEICKGFNAVVCKNAGTYVPNDK